MFHLWDFIQKSLSRNVGRKTEPKNKHIKSSYCSNQEIIKQWIFSISVYGNPCGFYGFRQKAYLLHLHVLLLSTEMHVWSLNGLLILIFNRTKIHFLQITNHTICYMKSVTLLHLPDPGICDHLKCFQSSSCLHKGLKWDWWTFIHLAHRFSLW